MESDGEEVRGFQTELLGVYHTETVSALSKHTGGRGLTKQLPARFTNEHIFQPLLTHLAGGCMEINEKTERSFLLFSFHELLIQEHRLKLIK